MIPLLLIALVLGFAAFELAWIKFYGKPVPPPNISRSPQTIGKGPKLTYVVLGDSTSIAQGGDYAQGYATATARYIAKTHTVTWVNVGVSGARANDVANLQLKQAVAYKPDIALVAVGANDVTHLTELSVARASLQKIISGLQAANPNVHIILTGSPDMGSPPRIPQPLRMLAGVRTQSLNSMVTGLTDGKRVVFAPIAEKTGPIFRANHHLYAADNFHPTTEGYKVWTPVLTGALDQVL
jgi:lysophospholipase L1-like esterase